MRELQGLPVLGVEGHVALDLGAEPGVARGEDCLVRGALLGVGEDRLDGGRGARVGGRVPGAPDEEGDEVRAALRLGEDRPVEQVLHHVVAADVEEERHLRPGEGDVGEVLLRPHTQVGAARRRPPPSPAPRRPGGTTSRWRRRSRQEKNGPSGSESEPTSAPNADGAGAGTATVAEGELVTGGDHRSQRRALGRSGRGGRAGGGGPRSTGGDEGEQREEGVAEGLHGRRRTKQGAGQGEGGPVPREIRRHAPSPARRGRHEACSRPHMRESPPS